MSLGAGTGHSRLLPIAVVCAGFLIGALFAGAPAVKAGNHPPRHRAEPMGLASPQKSQEQSEGGGCEVDGIPQAGEFRFGQQTHRFPGRELEIALLELLNNEGFSYETASSVADRFECRTTFRTLEDLPNGGSVWIALKVGFIRDQGAETGKVFSISHLACEKRQLSTEARPVKTEEARRLVESYRAGFITTLKQRGEENGPD